MLDAVCDSVRRSDGVISSDGEGVALSDSRLAVTDPSVALRTVLALCEALKVKEALIVLLRVLSCDRVRASDGDRVDCVGLSLAVRLPEAVILRDALTVLVRL